MLRKLVSIPLLLICIVGLIARLHQIEYRSLWFDEAWSWALSRRPLLDSIRVARGDFHPPAYFLFLRCWRSLFGDSIFWLRLPSVVFGCMVLPGCYLLAQQISHQDVSSGKWRDRLPGLLSASLVATSTTQIVWSQQVRMYSLLTCLVVWSTWVLFRAMSTVQQAPARGGGKPRGLRWAVAYVVLATLLCHTHNFGILIVATHGCCALTDFYVCNRSGPMLELTRSIVIRCVAASVLLFVPWLSWGFLGQLERVRRDFWIPPVRWDSIPLIFMDLIAPAVESRGTDVSLGLWAWAIILVSTCAFIRHGNRQTKYLVGIILGPTTIAAVFSMSTASIMQVRCFVPLGAIIIVLVASRISRISSTALQIAVSLVLISCSVGWHLKTVADLQVPSRRGARGIANHLLSHNQMPVVVISPTLFHAVQYYLPGHTVFLLSDSTIKPYQGGSILRSSEMITMAELQALGDFWVVDQRPLAEQATDSEWILGLPRMEPSMSYDIDSLRTAECDRLPPQYGFLDVCKCILCRRVTVLDR